MMTLAPKVYLQTYGCQMNVYDGELVSSLLQREGFQLTRRPENAEVILFNTCSVRDHAERRVLGRIQTLSALKKRRPHLLIGVLGCMGQRLGEDMKTVAPAVDLVLGPDSYRQLPHLLKEKLGGLNGHHYFYDGDPAETYGDVYPQRRDGVNAYVAIMRGCDNFCSYCIVPFARGRERNRPADEVLAEVQQAVAEGFPEVTLLGQNVNSYQFQGVSFAALLEEIAGIAGLQRLRFLTSHPRDLNDQIISQMARSGVICPALHLPVQSGSNRILNLMGRGYTREDYLDKVKRLRREVPDLALSTDLLCGFPTESEADFAQTLDLMVEAGFDSAFTFKYSPRPGTQAAQMPDNVLPAVKTDRLERMISLSRQLADASNRRWVGRQVEVLLEAPSPENKSEWTGKTRCGRIALVPGEFQRGAVVRIGVDHVRGFSLWGRTV